MKTIVFILALFISSIFVESVPAKAAPLAVKGSGWFFGDEGVNHSGARRFKSPKKRRGKRTCLKKGGCKTKGLHRHRGKCNAVSGYVL